MNQRTARSGVQPQNQMATISGSRKDSPLFHLLRATSGLKRFLDTSSMACLAFAILLGLALLAVCADAVLALSPTVRIVLNAMLVASLCGAFAVALRTILRNRFNPSSTARLIEERLGDRDSSFINAVDFSTSSPGGQSTQLRQRVIRIADERAHRISSLDVIQLRPLYRALGIAVAACLVLFVFHLAAPRLLAMVVPRFMDPHGDHPPFTLLDFEVTILPEPVYHGKPATIEAVLSGPETVEQASVVFLDKQRRSGEPIPMLRKQDQQFSLYIDRPEQSRAFYIDTPRGRSRTMHLDVVEVPYFEDVRFTYRYPEYTQWPSRETPPQKKGLRAIVGTEITVQARSNLPLMSGKLLLKESEASESDADVKQTTVTLMPLADDPTTVSGSFRIRVNGQYSISLEAANGAESLERIEGPITAIADKLPQISIVEPAPHVIVVEDWTVPTVIEAVDDIGISKVRIYRSVNGWGPSAADLPFTTRNGNGARSVYEFNLQELGARAGDVITYYASAWDNHPGGKQFRDSETYVIQVISRQEYQQYARQQYQMEELIAEFESVREKLDELKKQREELLEELEMLRKQLENTDQPTDEMLERLQKQEEQLQKFSKSAEQLAEQLDHRVEQMQLYELEEPYTEMLKRLSKQLKQQAQNANDVEQSLSELKQPGGANAEGRQQFQQALEKLQKEDEPFNEKETQQLDAAEQDLELFRMADNVLAAAEQLKLVIARQREVADRLAEFQNQERMTAEDQARADRLAGEQERLEQELQEVVDQLKQAAEAAQEELPEMSGDALKICEAIDEMQIGQDQKSAARNARQGSGRSAWEAAEAAANKLESLLSDCPNCNNSCEGMCNSLDGPLKLTKNQLKQCLDQLAQGRGIPGSGMPRPGSGNGQGQAGQGGIGQSGQAGQQAGGQGARSQWQVGQSFPGSQTPVAIIGPHAQQGMPQKSAGGRLGRNGRGSWIPLGEGNDPSEAETLTPDFRAFGSSTVGNLRAVPVGYRAAAEAYFKRLAEEK
ncbi:hypothetical protein Mal52_12060 [Symmachiella dynata]|uniref:Uncharacterized protein n=1 Tax=Symmachiella dynata TaxID=2527995 RepID=A0A517ZJT4_9PLAN|nr:hypothetical protein [Symmachiella dynata]QDU42739.1 hypothetical protein Mal52_12060 [Symmachiella dynata]